jgi:hypothetical protein
LVSPKHSRSKTQSKSRGPKIYLGHTKFHLFLEEGAPIVLVHESCGRHGCLFSVGLGRLAKTRPKGWSWRVEARYDEPIAKSIKLRCDATQ